MIPELGNFAIILALCFACLQMITPVLALVRKNDLYIYLSLSSAIGQLVFLTCALLVLIICFLNNDLTVIYVREHSHNLLPFVYRVGAAWGGHEGSLLLWCFILSGWTCLFILFRNKSLLTSFFLKILSILGTLSAGFILFLFTTSNPFKRDFPVSVITGSDLTPILQDPGLIFHPPMLYLGYVGFAIGFAFAVAALVEGQMTPQSAHACKPWVMLPWSFLSCGIVLGSWWAYRELGWGGWWFWDPVENASLLPWLSATALIHSLIVTEKRSAFQGWTILLAIITFSLSLLGTFLVRSGVLVSVHAFASDPTRGLFLLSYLTLIIGGTLAYYSYRIQHFYIPPQFQLFSRETFLLINSVILLAAIATILIGTLYPILLDALGDDKISVGEPYFNSVFLPIFLPLLVLMGIAPHLHWGQDSVKKIARSLRPITIIALFLGFCTPWALGFQFTWLAALGVTTGLWIILSTGQYIYRLFLQHMNIGLRYWAMILAHLGIAIIVLGVTLNKSYSEERQLKISPGEIASIAGYQFSFKKITEKTGPNYQSIAATFDVQSRFGRPKTLIAEQRVYMSHDQILSRPGILFNLWRDLYLALGAALPDNSWSIRIYYKPFVRWIWAGGILLLLSGMLSLLHYRRNPA